MNKAIYIFLMMMTFFQSAAICFPFSFKNKEDVFFKDLTNLKSQKLDENTLRNYYRDGIFFICDAENYSEVEGLDKKNRMVIGNFRFYVYSKNQNVQYNIQNIKIKTSKHDFNLNDVLYMPYPYEKPLQTEFSIDQQFPDYYISRYLLGYFKFPGDSNEKIQIIVNLICNGTEYEFVYEYQIIKQKSFISLND